MFQAAASSARAQFYSHRWRIDKTGSAGEENRFSLRIRLQPFPSCLNVLALLVSQDDVLDTGSAVGL